MSGSRNQDSKTLISKSKKSDCDPNDGSTAHGTIPVNAGASMMNTLDQSNKDGFTLSPSQQLLKGGDTIDASRVTPHENNVIPEDDREHDLGNTAGEGFHQRSKPRVDENGVHSQLQGNSRMSGDNMKLT